MILDDYAFSGDSLRQVKDLIKDLKKDAKISFATIKANPYSKINKNSFREIRHELLFEGKFDEANELDKKFLDINLPKEVIDLNENNFIYIDDSSDSFKPKPSSTGIYDFRGTSTPIKDKETRQKFLANRYQLRKDIKQYLHEKHPEKVSKKSSLEKIISGVFVFSFVVGLFLSSNVLTGNVIGNSGGGQKILGIILTLVGIGGFFVYRKFRE